MQMGDNFWAGNQQACSPLNFSTAQGKDAGIASISQLYIIKIAWVVTMGICVKEIPFTGVTDQLDEN